MHLHLAHCGRRCGTQPRFPLLGRVPISQLLLQQLRPHTCPPSVGGCAQPPAAAYLGSQGQRPSGDHGKDKKMIPLPVMEFMLQSTSPVAQAESGLYPRYSLSGLFPFLHFL